MLGPAAGAAGVTAEAGLAEAAGDVVLGVLLLWVVEDRGRVVVFDELAWLAGACDVEERGLVGHAGRLLHVVRHDDNGEGVLELVDEVLNCKRGDRVERGARLVHEDHGRLDCDGARDAQTLLLTTGKAGTWLVEAVLDFVPQVRAAQGLLDDLFALGVREALTVELEAREDVVLDRHGWERVWALEDHTDLGADADRVNAWAVNVVAVEQDLALDVCAWDDFVHAVQGPQEGGLTATGWADERGDRTRVNRHVDVFYCVRVAVVDVEV